MLDGNDLTSCGSAWCTELEKKGGVLASVETLNAINRMEREPYTITND
jgi:hypothetical protein